jgi:hypothetical protein
MSSISFAFINSEITSFPIAFNFSQGVSLGLSFAFKSSDLKKQG